MIRLTRINHESLVLNSDLIEHVSITPDTVITLTNGQVFMVLETADDIIRQVRDFRRSVFAEALRCPYQARSMEEEAVLESARDANVISNGD